MKPYYLKTKETQPLVGIITVCSLELPTFEYQLWIWWWDTYVILKTDIWREYLKLSVLTKPCIWEVESPQIKMSFFRWSRWGERAWGQMVEEKVDLARDTRTTGEEDQEEVVCLLISFEAFSLHLVSLLLWPHLSWPWRRRTDKETLESLCWKT